jgi:hypothetical protein
MNKVYLESSKRIANPSAVEVAEGRPTVFDTWIHRYPDSSNPPKPKYIYSLSNSPIFSGGNMMREQYPFICFSPWLLLGAVAE